MARKSEYGKYIISAGEVGEYVVCPEAWRLKMVEGKKSFDREKSRLGAELHKQWAEDYDEAMFLTRGVKIIATLVIFAIVLFLFTNL